MPISTIGQNGLNAPLTLTLPVVATTMGVGGATPSGSGSGITFPATQSASSDANTLDDYEEGTFTPTYVSSGATFTYGNAYGYYIKIGRCVHITINIMTNGVSVSNSSATVSIGNLPFTAANATESLGGISISSSSRYTSNPPSSGWVATNATLISLFRNGTSFITGEDPTQLTVSDLVTTSGNRNTIRLSATYFSVS